MARIGQSSDKGALFSVPGTDERHLFNIDTKVTQVGDDLTRGFKFVGAGKMAVLPETRLKINVDAFFNGRLEAYALRRPEMSIRMNVVNGKNGDKVVRLCSVLTFDEMTETVDFGGMVFTKRPRITREERISKCLGMKVISHAATLMLMAAPRGPRFSSADRLASRQSAAIDQLSPQSMSQSASRVEVREERRRRGSGSQPYSSLSCVLVMRPSRYCIASRIISLQCF